MKSPQLRSRFASDIYIADWEETVEAMQKYTNTFDWSYLSTEPRELYINGVQNPPVTVHVIKISKLINGLMSIDSTLESLTAKFRGFDDPGTRSYFHIGAYWTRKYPDYPDGQKGWAEIPAPFYTNDTSTIQKLPYNESNFANVYGTLFAFDQLHDPSDIDPFMNVEWICFYTTEANHSITQSVENDYPYNGGGTEVGFVVNIIG